MRFGLTLIAGLLSVSCAHAESLLEFVQQVRATDPRFEMLEAAQDREEARSQQARAKLLPQLAAQGGWNRSEYDVFGSKVFDVPATNGKKFTLSLQQPVLNVGALYGYSASKKALAQSELQRMEGQSEAIMDAIDRYLLALSAAEKLTLAREEESTALKQLEQVRGLRERQMATITDLLTIQARSDALNVMRIRAEVEYRAALDAMEQLTGQPVSGLQGLSADQVSFSVEQSLTWWQDKVEKENWQIKALAAGADAARLAVSQSRASSLPVVSLQVATQQNDLGFQNNPVPRSRSNYASLDITVPLFAGGNIMATVHEASANKRIAETQYQKASREIVAKARSAYMQLQSLTSAIAAAKRAVDSTAQSLQAKERSYQLGVESIANVLEARRDSFAAQRDFAEARHEFIRQWAILSLFGATLDDNAVNQASAWLVRPLSLP